MNKIFRPQRSTTQVTFRQKRMAIVALRALIKAMVDDDVKTFL